MKKKTYTLNVHRHNQATRIGWDERKSQQPCRHDGEGVFASLIPWQILRELRFRKERTIILLRLTKTDPNKWRMIWYTDIDCWYGFGVHISISILLIYIIYIYIYYIYMQQMLNQLSWCWCWLHLGSACMSQML
jgi:hypothetical protein